MDTLEAICELLNIESIFCSQEHYTNPNLHKPLWSRNFVAKATWALGVGMLR